MLTVKDAIHGNIYFSENEVAILDAQEVQRLRNIKQLGFTYLVYPSATHTRFEHSIGVYFLAEKLGGKLNLKKEELQKLKIAAILHDIGHGPFSHSSEDALKSHLGEKFSHEKNTVFIIKKSEISDIIKKMGFRPDEIIKIILGKKPPVSKIISSEIDVDRMDYLVRDSYHTGATYGVIDIDRTLDMLKLYGKDLAFAEEGLSSAEAFVRARYSMYPTVYEHHTTRTINAMFSFAVVSCLREKLFAVDELIKMDDIEIISRLRNLDNFAGSIMRKILQRNLYKRALVLKKDDLKGSFKKFADISAKKFESLEQEIIEKCNLKPGEALLDIPAPLYSKGAEAGIFSKGKIRKLSELSPTISSLNEAQWNYWDVSVYAEKGNVEKVAKAGKKVFL